MSFPGTQKVNKSSGDRFYKASNNAKVTYPTESINTTQKYELMYMWYATTIGDVKVSIDLKCSGSGTSPSALMYAIANRGQSSSSSLTNVVLWSDNDLGVAFPLDTTTPLGTESGSDPSGGVYDSTILGSNTATTYATYTTILRVQRPGPIFFVLKGQASAGATSLNCSAKNLVISYDLVS
jgi:hypothetical protein